MAAPDHSDHASPQPPPRGPINDLFRLLVDLEAVSHGSLVEIRSHTGQALVYLGVRNRMLSLGGAVSQDRLHERDQLAQSLAPELCSAIEASGAVVDDVLVGVVPLPAGLPGGDKALSTLVCNLLASELFRVTGGLHGDPSLVRAADLRVVEGAAPPVTALAVMLAMTNETVRLEDDLVIRLADEWEDEADGLIVLARPSKRSFVPLPVTVRGFDGLPLADLVPICRSALEMCWPERVAAAGIEPVLITRSTPHATWAAAAGERGLILIRLTTSGKDAHRRSRVIGSAMRLVR